MKLFGRERRAAEPSVPRGTRVYAIGDIHGRADLLREIHRLIRADFERAPVERPVVVYLGDYIDRGLESRQVVDLMLDEPLIGFERVHLRGNHEDFMLRFLDDAAIGSSWMLNGGAATVYSYVGSRHGTDNANQIQTALREALTGRHLDFFRGLSLFHVEGDYLFVHAGIRPNVPLEKQDPMDLMWICEDFLNATVEHPKMIVHGHSIHFTPEIRPNRIGIDTGAYATGTLTCLMLQGTRRDFLHTL
jgi:serine/threonine protein phosphatase 1